MFSRKSGNQLPQKRQASYNNEDYLPALNELAEKIATRKWSDSEVKQNYYFQLIKDLLRKNTSLHLIKTTVDICPYHHFRSEKGKTLLHLIVELESYRLLDWYINNVDINLNLISGAGNTPLSYYLNMLPANQINVPFVYKLLEIGACLRNANNEINPCSLLKVSSQDENFLCYIVNKKIIKPEDDFIGGTLLHYASMLDNFNFFKCVLKNATDVNLRNSDGDTPLHRLYKVGVWAIPRVNFTPFFFEIKLKKLDLLLEKGADINAVNALGRTPLHCAILKTPFFEHLPENTLTHFVSKGAQLNVHPDNEGFTLRDSYLLRSSCENLFCPDFTSNSPPPELYVEHRNILNFLFPLAVYEEYLQKKSQFLSDVFRLIILLDACNYLKNLIHHNFSIKESFRAYLNLPVNHKGNCSFINIAIQHRSYKILKYILDENLMTLMNEERGTNQLYDLANKHITAALKLAGEKPWYEIETLPRIKKKGESILHFIHINRNCSYSFFHKSKWKEAFIAQDDTHEKELKTINGIL